MLRKYPSCVSVLLFEPGGCKKRKEKLRQSTNLGRCHGRLRLAHRALSDLQSGANMSASRCTFLSRGAFSLYLVVQFKMRCRQAKGRQMRASTRRLRSDSTNTQRHNLRSPSRPRTHLAPSNFSFGSCVSLSFPLPDRSKWLERADFKQI